MCVLWTCLTGVAKCVCVCVAMISRCGHECCGNEVAQASYVLVVVLVDMMCLRIKPNMFEQWHYMVMCCCRRTHIVRAISWMWGIGVLICTSHVRCTHVHVFYDCQRVDGFELHNIQTKVWPVGLVVLRSTCMLHVSFNMCQRLLMPTL